MIKRLSKAFLKPKKGLQGTQKITLTQNQLNPTAWNQISLNVFQLKRIDHQTRNLHHNIKFGFSEQSSQPESGSQEVKAVRKVELRDEDLEWKFVRGGGKGGQKTNKTSNCVVLKHIPTQIMVKCHKTRELEKNKQFAKKYLKEKLDIHYNQGQSKREVSNQKKKKSKAKRRQRSRAKHQSKAAESKGGQKSSTE